MKDIKELKEKISSGLDYLENFNGDGSCKKLREMLAKTDDPAILFQMYQTFREALKPEDTSFKVRLKDGTIKQFTSLQEAEKYMKETYE